jgi:hypothetical protein
MKPNQNFSVKPIVKYLREVSVVVIGVAITIFASQWLGIKNEKRDMNLHLYAVRLELDENIKILDTIIHDLTPSVKYIAYLQSNDKKILNNDSLMNFFQICYTIKTYSFKTNAFEMFKTSGLMRLMEKQELLLTIWDAYAELVELKQALEEYNKIKWSFMEKDMPQLEKNMEQNRLTYLSYIPMYSFHNLGVSYSIQTQCKRSLDKIKEMVLKFDEK